MIDSHIVLSKRSFAQTGFFKVQGNSAIMHWSAILISWKLVLLLIFTSGPSASGEDDAFKNYLVRAMQDYPAWLHSSQLDPSSPLDYEVDLSYTSCRMNLHGSIKNQVMINYSRGYQSGDITVTSNLSERSFSYSLNHSGTLMKVQGDYSLEGSVIEDSTETPVKGEGRFESLLSIGSPGVVFSVEHFEVTPEPDGFIDLSQASIEGSVIAWSERQYFSELYAGEFKAEVVKVLKRRFEEQLDSWMPGALTKVMTDYFTRKFSSTKVSEILRTSVRKERI